MQLNTVIKLGSLAFNVAQDEKVRELATIIHHGARRRGLFDPTGGMMANPLPTQSTAKSTAGKTQSQVPIPFAPTQSSTPSQPAMPNYLTMDNAKKMLGWAGQIANLLVK